MRSFAAQYYSALKTSVEASFTVYLSSFVIKFAIKTRGYLRIGKLE
jgi:hypothetical protein